MLSICTANDKTLAIGESVPVTNDGPVCCEELVVLVFVEVVLQPFISRAATAIELNRR
jgi:hypothetical protein